MSKLVVPLHCFRLKLGTAGLRVRCADPRSRCLLYHELIFAQDFSSLEECFSLSLARDRKGLGNGISSCFHLAKYYNLFFPFFSWGFEIFAAQSRFYINLYTNNERGRFEDFPYPLARYIRYFNYFFFTIFSKFSVLPLYMI